MVPEKRGFCQEAPRRGSQLGKDWIAKGLQKQPEEFSGHHTGTSTWPTSGASEVAQKLVTIQQEPCLCLMVHHLVEKWLAEAREISMMPRFLEQLELPPLVAPLNQLACDSSENEPLRLLLKLHDFATRDQSILPV